MSDSVMQERSALADTMEAAGPTAPTLCEGWQTLDLAAHLVLRERDPLGAPGILLPGPFARLTEQRMAAARRRGWDRLLADVRRPPPLHFRLAPEGVNLMEYVVHHEDVRRANGEEPRTLDPHTDDGLWAWLGRVGRFYVRTVDATIVLRRPDGAAHRLRSSGPAVTVTGATTELALYLNGRKAAAQVELEGDPQAIERLRAADLGV